jgi:cardiolipin synthase
MGLATLLHIAAFILVCTHCLRHRRGPSATILWILVAWSFPIIGPLLYLSFGITRIPDKGFKKHSSNQRLLQKRQSLEQEEKDSSPLAYWRAVHDAGQVEPESEWCRNLNNTMNSILPNHHLLGGNSIIPLVSGDAAFPAMRKVIRNAKHHIHLQSFIIGNDVIGKNFLELLAEKAREGIQVRIMYDRFGSTYAVLGRLFRKYKNIPNFQLIGWTQANILKRQFQVNLRNHRKIMVVDGKIGFMGGMNMSVKNISGKGYQPIRDYHFQIEGAIVQELQYSFMKDWHFITNEDPYNILTEAYFPHIESGGNAMMRMINSGPTKELATIRDTFFMAFTQAKKQIISVTPYLVPPPEIIEALRSAAMRGVDVRLIVPQKNNHLYAGLAGRSLYTELLTSGIRIFERFPPFIHAKATIIDDEFSLIGTANLDVRSLHLNYESNLAIYDENFTNKLKEIILDDQAQSKEIIFEDWIQRSGKTRILENLAYLMMPML